MPNTLTITDTIHDPLTNTPSVGARVSVQPSVNVLFVNGNAVIGATEEQFVTTDTTGAWTAVLPWPSICDPSSVKWTIRLPDTSVHQGTVPSITGPVTLATLRTTYSWS